MNCFFRVIASFITINKLKDKGFVGIAAADVDASPERDFDGTN
jgi:hypothetical protein